MSYKGRTREEGEKLIWRDGVEERWILTRLHMRSGNGPSGRRQAPRRPGAHQVLWVPLGGVQTRSDQEVLRRCGSQDGDECR
jgi:hypothetical protein